VLGVFFGGLGLVPAESFAGQSEGVGLIVYVLVTALALGAALIPFSYDMRATLMVVIAALCGLAGVVGFGPASVLAQGAGEWGLLHLLAATALPAALLFRARYRAYSGARRILAAALVLALPFIAYCALAISREVLAVQIACALAIMAVSSSLVGFMGSETNVGGEYLAALIVLGVSAQLGTGALMAVDGSIALLEIVAKLASVVAFMGVAVLGALGVSQLLAGRHWRLAREVDVRRTTERQEMKSLGDSWSTRR